jgi:hypothetical protein
LQVFVEHGRVGHSASAWQQFGLGLFWHWELTQATSVHTSGAVQSPAPSQQFATGACVHWLLLPQASVVQGSLSLQTVAAVAAVQQPSMTGLLHALFVQTSRVQGF